MRPYRSIVPGAMAGRLHDNFCLPSFLPPHSGPVDFSDGIRNPKLCPIIGDSFAARFDSSVVVDDDEPADGKLGIKRLQGDVGGFVHVAVEPDKRKWARIQPRQGIAKEPLYERYLVIKQAITIEICFHLIERNRQFRDCMEDVSDILWEQLGIRRGQPFNELAT